VKSSAYCITNWKITDEIPNLLGGDIMTTEEKLKEIEKLISGMWDDESVFAGEIREILDK
jgi:hypothetical protein